MKSYTQEYDNCAPIIQAYLYKINRQDNVEADSLARLARAEDLIFHQPC
jgi:hypothetical protein